jgi:hypothetical protein
MVFLLISFSTIYGSKFTSSYGQISLVPDNSLIAQTTDCITSMMTGALIGINSDCTDNLNKINSTYPDKAPDSSTSVSSSSDKAPDSSTSVSSHSNSNPYNLSKNNPFYHEFQSKNTVNGDVSTPTFTSDSSNMANGNYMDTFQSPPQDNPSTFTKSPPQDNPSTFSELQQQNLNRPVSNPYSFQSFHTSINKNIYTNPTNSELGASLDGKNKHSKEISACFDRAFSIDNYLSDSEIIECAKDRDSFK